MNKEVVSLNSSEKETPQETKNPFRLFAFISGKNLKIIVLIIIFIVALVVFFKLSGEKSSSKTSSVSSSQVYLTSLEYSQALEQKLEGVLSQVKGAGQVKVMISLDGSPELKYAMDSDTNVSNSSNGITSSTSSESPILVGKNGSTSPLILTEILPKVKGVIVVSSGANDISIKLDILNSVSTLLGISTDKINVLKGN